VAAAREMGLSLASAQPRRPRYRANARLRATVRFGISSPAAAQIQAEEAKLMVHDRDAAFGYARRRETCLMTERAATVLHRGMAFQSKGSERFRRALRFELTLDQPAPN
jgi:hypothetical protein